MVAETRPRSLSMPFINPSKSQSERHMSGLRQAETNRESVSYGPASPSGHRSVARSLPRRLIHET